MVDPFHRRAADIQMRATLGAAYTRWLCPKVFMNHGDILIDTIRYAYMDDDEMREKIVVEGRQHLEDALAGNKGLQP